MDLEDKTNEEMFNKYRKIDIITIEEELQIIETALLIRAKKIRELRHKINLQEFNTEGSSILIDNAVAGIE